MTQYNLDQVNVAVSAIIGVLDNEGILGGHTEGRELAGATVRNILTRGVRAGNLNPVRLNISDHGIVLNVTFRFGADNHIVVQNIHVFSIGHDRQEVLQEKLVSAVLSALVSA